VRKKKCKSDKEKGGYGGKYQPLGTKKEAHTVGLYRKKKISRAKWSQQEVRVLITGIVLLKKVQVTDR